jgi:hypothetical protein
MDKRWRRATEAGRNPILHFFLGGLVLFAAERGWQDRIVGRAVAGPPEAALEREALRLGLDRGDRLVRDRLVKLARFLGLADPSDDDALEREARALGLEREDPVIRRYLAHQMQVALAGPALPPDESEVRQRYDSLVAVAPRERRFRLQHVYLGRDRHGSAVRSEAESLLHRLIAEGIGPDGAQAFGDPFAAGSEIGPLTPPQLDRVFGPGFAAAVETAPEHGWSGPIESSYGEHLIWVSERSSSPPPQLADVRNQIVASLMRERQSERLTRALQQLR